jgi:hypothetical protein
MQQCLEIIGIMAGALLTLLLLASLLVIIGMAVGF